MVKTLSRQGRKKTLSLADLNILDSLVKDKKDWYLDEMVDEMERLTGKLISIPTLWRALKHLGMTRKKLQKAAKERSELLRSYKKSADIIEGSCNKERFQTFILTQVLPQMNEYPNKNSHCLT
ncbi:homeodomain-like protein [Rhizophagus clarus]|uniref:Homeodomain-like protein n=1 Tax=Rhizophagus clarus TaxID=94130 RepID=A0A8H3M998_9GLOM|nr:homeodomain-like protein [Rhizophagus clarus]